MGAPEQSPNDRQAQSATGAKAGISMTQIVQSDAGHATIKTVGCDLMHKLAQEHANDMARRETLDHAGFAMRARLGARAENVAMGHASKAKTLAQWRASARHAANMRLPGLQGCGLRNIAFRAILLGNGDRKVAAPP